MQMSETISPAPLRELAAIVFSMKKTIIAALLIPPIIAVALVFVLPPTYRAEAQLLIKTGHEYLPEAAADASLAGPTATKQEAINSEIELLTNRAFAEKVINTVGLKNLYPGLVENPPMFGTVLDQAIKRFQKALDVAPVKMSNILDLTYDADTPAEASKMLDTIIRLYLTEHTQVYKTGARRGYEEVIGHDMADLDRLQQEQATIKIDNQIYDIAPQRAALIQQRVDAQTHLQEAIDRKATLDSQIAALAGRYAPNNPELVRLRAQIAAVQAQTKSLGDGLKVTMQPAQLSQQIGQELVMDRVELAPLAAEVTRYQGLIAGYGRELARLEHADTALRINQAEIDNVQANVQQMRLRLDQARTQDDMDAARMTSVVQIAPAVTPDKPASPKPVLFTAVGLLFGLFLAGGIIVLAIITRRTFYTAIGLERQLGLPVLASVDMVSMRGNRKALLLE
jgi:uncharacterized protein involved in exopolysaccharide biosynthesis